MKNLRGLEGWYIGKETRINEMFAGCDPHLDTSALQQWGYISNKKMNDMLHTRRAKRSRGM